MKMKMPKTRRSPGPHTSFQQERAFDRGDHVLIDTNGDRFEANTALIKESTLKFRGTELIDGKMYRIIS
jgi:hypothetical protein